MYNPWRVVGVALGATALVAFALNAQFFWLTLRHELAPEREAAPEPVIVQAVEVARQRTAAEASTSWVGITNADLAKIPVGVLPVSGSDEDNDGIPDELERVLGTNPKQLDTDGDRMSDLSELLVNRDPLGGGVLPVDLAFASRQRGRYLLQVESRGELWYVNPQNSRRYFVPTPNQAVAVALAFAVQPVLQRQVAPSTLSIASLGLEAPVVYVAEANERSFQDGLALGVVHYPGTARPGEWGNVFIFGHSSDYRWSAGQYKNVFAALPNVALGADVTVSDAAGRAFTYRVYDKKVVLPTETAYLGQYGFRRKLLTLQTSWPIGTALKRYLVLAELVEP